MSSARRPSDLINYTVGHIYIALLQGVRAYRLEAARMGTHNHGLGVG